MEGHRRLAQRPRHCGHHAGFAERAFGVAIDVGSTTIAAHLTDLTSGEVVAAVGAMNPQIRFGEDLMSRVSYVRWTRGRQGADACRARGDGRADWRSGARGRGGTGRNSEVTLVGNPIMHHLVLGLDPTELGGGAFALTVDAATRRARANWALT